MKKKVTIIYSIFAVAVYLFAISFFAYNLISEYSTGIERTKRRFDSTTGSFKHLFNNFDDEHMTANDIKKAVKLSVGNLDDFAFVELYKDGKVIYSYNKDTLKDNSSSKLLKKWDASFKASDSNYYLNANLYLLRPASIYYYGKIAFLIILIVTSITFVLIIIDNINSIQNEPEPEEEDVISFVDETEADEKVIAISPTPSAHQTVSQKELEIVKTENDVLEEEKTEQETSEEVTPNTTAPLAEEGPAGLFNPNTGLGWESYLKTRLNNEINRAISSESDVSLFLIKFENLSKEDDKMLEVSDYLIELFQFKDLLFEYKEDCVAVIKINSTIDDSIALADQIHKDFSFLFAETDIKCYIGLTARTVRMVNGERLLLEADQALQHAKDENEAIVAFRADADKFREYIESN